MDNKEVVFSTTDPLDRTIVLKQSTYDNHIKDRHDETAIKSIKQNIEQPSLIIKNNKEQTGDAKRQCYLSFNTTMEKLHINKTVVEFKDENTGEIVTNYICRKINEDISEGGVVYDARFNNDSKRENGI